MIRWQHSLFITPYTTTHHNNNYYYSTNTTSPPIAPSRLTGCHPAPTRHCHECGLHPTSCDFIFPPPVKLYEVSSHRRVIWATAASLPACHTSSPQPYRPNHQLISDHHPWQHTIQMPMLGISTHRTISFHTWHFLKRYLFTYILEISPHCCRFHIYPFFKKHHIS